MRKIGKCIKCSEERELVGRLLCSACYARASRKDELHQFPLLPKPKKKKCRTRGCNNQGVSKGYCWTCYQAARRSAKRITA